MKKMTFRLATCLCICLSVAIHAQDLPSIAVYVTGDIPETEKRVLSTRILNALIRNGQHVSAEQSNAFLAELESEQSEESATAMTDAQISEVAKRFGIESLFIAELTHVLGEYNISARIIDIETAATISVGEAHGPLETMGDIAQLTDGLIGDMFGRQTRAETQPQPVPASGQPIVPEPAPEPAVAVTVTFTPAPLPAPIALRAGTSMADRAKSAAAEKILETVMSQITPQIKRMVSAAPVSAEVKVDAEQRLTLTARNLVTTMLNDGMSGKMPNPQQLLTQVLGEIKNLARDLLGNISIDITAEGGGGSGGEDSKRRMSFGFGGFYSGDYGGGLKWTNSGERVKMPYNGGGGYLFFDMIFGEIFIGYSGGGGKWQSGGYDLPNMSRTYINYGGFAKLPLSNSGWSLLAGTDYEMSMTCKLNGSNIYWSQSALWFRFGIGFDVDFNPNSDKSSYFRMQMLYGFRSANDFENELVNTQRRLGRYDTGTNLGHGLSLKMGIGFKL